MMQAIRDKAQGWIAWTIVILISIPFALWGVDQYAQGERDEPVAVVGDVEITPREFSNAYQRQKQMLQEQFGDMFDQIVKDDELKEQIMQGLIQQAVMVNASEVQGYTISDAHLAQMIQNSTVFHKDGKFDQERYELLLSNAGWTPGMYEREERQLQQVGQLESGISGSTMTTEAEYAFVEQLSREERNVAFYTLSLTEKVMSVSITDESVAQFFEQNKEDYRVPEKVVVDYIELNSEMLGKEIQPSEEDLVLFFQDNQIDYQTPEERKASHILIAKEEKAKAEDLLKQIKEGADFAELAKQHSIDPGSGAQGGDLGFFGLGMMVEPFEKAAFALNVDEVSELVETQFGYHIIKVTDIKASTTPELDAIKSQVLADYQAREGAKIYQEQYERLANLTYEQPTTLEPASEVLGIAIQSSTAFDRTNHSEGIAHYPKVVEAAFSEAVLQDGLNSQVLELSANSAVVIRLNKRIDSYIPDMAEVATDIKERLIYEEATKALNAEAQLAVKQPDASQFGDSVWVQRGTQSISPAIVREAYRIAENGGVKQVTLENGDIAIVKLNERRLGEELIPAQKDALKQALQQINQKINNEVLIETLTSQTEIER